MFEGTAKVRKEVQKAMLDILRDEMEEESSDLERLSSASVAVLMVDTMNLMDVISLSPELRILAVHAFRLGYEAAQKDWISIKLPTQEELKSEIRNAMSTFFDDTDEEDDEDEG